MLNSQYNSIYDTIINKNMAVTTVLTQYGCSVAQCMKSITTMNLLGLQATENRLGSLWSLADSTHSGCKLQQQPSTLLAKASSVRQCHKCPCHSQI